MKGVSKVLTVKILSTEFGALLNNIYLPHERGAFTISVWNVWADFNAIQSCISSIKRVWRIAVRLWVHPFYQKNQRNMLLSFEKRTPEHEEKEEISCIIKNEFSICSFTRVLYASAIHVENVTSNTHSDRVWGFFFFFFLLFSFLWFRCLFSYLFRLLF